MFLVGRGFSPARQVRNHSGFSLRPSELSVLKQLWKARATMFAIAILFCCRHPLLAGTPIGQPDRGPFLGIQPQRLSFSKAFAGSNQVAKDENGDRSSAPEPNLLPERTSLAPRFSPGQVFRYAMEFQTTTSTSRSGLGADPQGPSTLVITWDATIRMEVLPPKDPAAGGTRLRITYEKSTANVNSDSFDPTAEETQAQYRKLAGKAVEFTLDTAGNVTSVSGLGGIMDGERAAQAARDWISRLDASSGAPPGGVKVGETWVSEQPADSLPVAGLVWRTDSQYLRNEPCRPPNPDLPPAVSAELSTGTGSAANSGAADTCAVILAHLNLVHEKSGHNETPEVYRKNGVRTSGKWSGTGQSLIYISLRNGSVVSVSQTGTEDMNVTMTNRENVSLHYAGTVLSRSQVELIPGDSQGKLSPGKTKP
jgi:hypothetical protein